MKTISKLIAWLVVDAAAYAWLVHGVDGAGNLLAAFLWVLFLASILTAFCRPTKPIERSGVVLKTAGVVSRWSLLTALVWTGNFGLAALLALAMLLATIYFAKFDEAGNVKPEAGVA